LDFTHDPAFIQNDVETGLYPHPHVEKAYSVGPNCKLINTTALKADYNWASQSIKQQRK
jgi:hypothetical protein